MQSGDRNSGKRSPDNIIITSFFESKGGNTNDITNLLLPTVYTKEIAEEIHLLSLSKINEINNKIFQKIKNENEFTLTESEVNEILMQNVEHIIEENIEVLALAEGMKGDPDVGIFYPQRLNNTAAETGRLSINKPGFWPKKLALITKINSPDEIVPFYNYLSKDLRKFNYKDATLFIPICYGTSHALAGENFKNTIEFFAKQGVANIIVYLGRDANRAENILNRQNWLQNHVQIINDFRNNKENTSVLQVLHRAQLIETQAYQKAEALFVELFGDHDEIQAGVVKDILTRMNQKSQIKKSLPSLCSIQTNSGSPPNKPAQKTRQPKSKLTNSTSNSASPSYYSQGKLTAIPEEKENDEILRLLAPPVVHGVATGVYNDKEQTILITFFKKIENFKMDTNSKPNLNADNNETGILDRNVKYKDSINESIVSSDVSASQHIASKVIDKVAKGISEDASNFLISSLQQYVKLNNSAHSLFERPSFSKRKILEGLNNFLDNNEIDEKNISKYFVV